jgi:hypothetical protein
MYWEIEMSSTLQDGNSFASDKVNDETGYLPEASVIARERALTRSAVNCATYIRFSYPLWLRAVALISVLVLSSSFIFAVLLFYPWPSPSIMPIDIKTGLFLSAAANFVGFCLLSISGFAAEQFSKSVGEWWKHLNSIDAGKPI